MPRLVPLLGQLLLLLLSAACARALHSFDPASFTHARLLAARAPPATVRRAVCATARARVHAAATARQPEPAAFEDDEEEKDEDEASAEPAQAEDGAFAVGQRVRVEVVGFSPLGCNVRVDAEAEGLIFSSEMAYPPRLGNWTNVPLRKGDVVMGYVMQVREDRRLDIAVRKFGFAKAESSRAALILALLASPDGRLPIGDRTPPAEVRAALAISKSQFKIAAGALWKAELVERPGPDELKLTASVFAEQQQQRAGGGGAPTAAAAQAQPPAAAGRVASVRAGGGKGVTGGSLADAASSDRVVFVQGLPFGTQPSELYAHLHAHFPGGAPAGIPQAVGDPASARWVASIRGLEGSDGRPSGRAWVEFVTAESAASLLAAVAAKSPSSSTSAASAPSSSSMGSAAAAAAAALADEAREASPFGAVGASARSSRAAQAEVEDHFSIDFALNALDADGSGSGSGSAEAEAETEAQRRPAEGKAAANAGEAALPPVARMGERELEWMPAESRVSRQAMRLASLPSALLGSAGMSTAGSGGFGSATPRAGWQSASASTWAAPGASSSGAAGEGAVVSGSTVFVANLPFDVTEAEVRTLFASCGKMRRAAVPLDELGRSRGFAHVGFETAEGAQAALAFSGRMFARREVRVELANDKPGPRRSPFDRGSGMGKGSSNFYKPGGEDSAGEGGGGEGRERRPARPAEGGARGDWAERRGAASGAAGTSYGGGGGAAAPYARRDDGDSAPGRRGSSFGGPREPSSNGQPARPFAPRRYDDRPARPGSSYGGGGAGRSAAGDRPRDGFERRVSDRDRERAATGGDENAYSARPSRPQRDGSFASDPRTDSGKGDGAPRYRVVKFATSDFDVGRDS